MQRHAASFLITQQIQSRSLLVTHVIISYNCCWEEIHYPSYPTWRGQVFALCLNRSQFIKFTTADWRIGSDIALTFLLIFYVCTNYETGPSCICRIIPDQTNHKRLKIIHLNFQVQNMELTSVQHNSGQLFQRSNSVHAISVQPRPAIGSTMVCCQCR